MGVWEMGAWGWEHEEGGMGMGVSIQSIRVLGWEQVINSLEYGNRSMGMGAFFPW